MKPLQDGDDERCSLAPLAPARARSARVAATTMLLGFVLLVGAGALGRFLVPPSSPPSPADRALDGASSGRRPPATPSPAVPDRASDMRMRTLAGYAVDYATDALHRPMIFDDGAVAIYEFGPRGPDGTYGGEIHVSVGTPAGGAAVLSHSGYAIVFGTTLRELDAAYARTMPGRIVARGTGTLDGVATTTLEIESGPSGVAFVVLAVQGNRAFVLTAAGFKNLYPGAGGTAARAGMNAFSAGFRFGAALFVSRELGFQVPLPVRAHPSGSALAVPLARAQGLEVFPAGRRRGDTWTHLIGVSVGTEANPALVTVLPGASSRPDPFRIWAAGLVALQAAYPAAIGGAVGSTSIVSLGAELALRIDEPGGLAAVVLAVHRGRVYIISTTGAAGPEIAPGFEEFLAGFAFLD